MPPELHPRPAAARPEPRASPTGRRSAQVNPQRFEMEQLDGHRLRRSASSTSSSATRTCAPTSSGCAATCRAIPLLPGVLMCEAAAQLCSYYIVSTAG